MISVSYIVPVCKWNGNSANGNDYKFRIENLKFIIDKFIVVQKYVSIELIFIEQSLDGNFYYDGFENRCSKFIRITGNIFNKSRLYNIAAKESKENFLLFAEADMFSDDTIFINNLMDNCRNKKWVIGWDKMRYTSRYERDMLLANISISKRSNIVNRGIGKGHEGGIVFFNKSFFDEIGGYNESLEELGGIDNEISVRANFLSKEYYRCPGFIYHMWHPITKNNAKPLASRIKNSKILKEIKNNPMKYISTKGIKNK